MTRFQRELIAGVIRRILISEPGDLTVPGLAAEAGFSRFHLSRLFRLATGESMHSLIRRINLERGGWALRRGSTVLEAGVSAGYGSLESFSRAFSDAYGLCPTDFKRSNRDWVIGSRELVHWNPQWAAEALSNGPKAPYRIVRRSAACLAVKRFAGNYGQLADLWEAFASELDDLVKEDRVFVTVYHDNMWTHPDSNSMRADLGWVLRPAEDPPRGMRCMMLPAGHYAVTERFLERKERNEGWAEMSGRFSDRRTLALDEYAGWPLPFERVRTRIVIALDAPKRALS